MSINFQGDMNPAVQEMLRDTFGDQLVAMDARQALFDAIAIKSTQMCDIARAAKQPVTLEIHEDGEIKTMSDGTQYRVTSQGWRKIT